MGQDRNRELGSILCIKQISYKDIMNNIGNIAELL